MSNPNLDPRMPAAEDCVTRLLIERRAAETPEKTFAIFPDGSSWTYAQFESEVVAAAAGLAKLGIGQGDHVVTWLPNGQDALRAWFAINWLGAVYVPINTAYKGSLLAHVIANSDAEVVIGHNRLLPRLAEIGTARLKRVVALGKGDRPELPGLVVHGPEALRLKGEADPAPEWPLMPWHTQSIIYTSGTTGPSKGVLSSYLHLYTTAGVAGHLGPGDRYMVNLPLFHVGGTMPVAMMLARGGSISMIEAFDTATFWDTVRDTGITAAIMLGVMAQFLAKAEPRPDDANNPLRLAMLVPYDFDARDFARRFDTRVFTLFNMTEISCPIVSELDPGAVHSAGTVRPGFECRVVDDNDCEVADGEVGELVVRADIPWTMNHGYYKNAEATAKAWRNGWFHTGDGFRRDANGEFYFVDRMKDAIRRRGENISSYEVEAEVLIHPDVAECAALAVPGEVSEDEILVVVAPAEGRSVDPAALIEFLVPRMAYFMVPRYVRILGGLPRTPTQKVRKTDLRAQGITEDTFDREAAGIRLRRERINS